MGSLVDWMDNKYYAGQSRNWDDTMFREEILKHITPDSILLDLGAGAGIVEQMNFRGLVGQVHGVDLDPRVKSNPFLDEGRICDANNIPYEDLKFDIVFSDNVLEHLDQPDLVFKEVARVLKVGGVFLFKTPNKYHYMPAIASITPHRFHQFVNRRRGREEVDTFPTRYRANCRKDIRALAERSNMEVKSLDLVEGRPEYLRMNFLTYLIGLFYERLVNWVGVLSSFRVLLIGAILKK